MKPAAYRKMFGVAEPTPAIRRRLSASASASAAALVRIPSRPTLDAHLGSLLRKARLHRRVTRPLEADHDVVGLLPSLRLAPPVGKEVLEPVLGGSPQLVAAGNPNEEPFVQERIEALKAEIARVEAHMQRAQIHRSAADELFKKS